MQKMGNNSKPTSNISTHKLKPSLDAFFVELNNRIQTNPISLKKHLKQFVFGDFNSEDQNKISQILQEWKDFPLADLIKSNLQQKDIQIYEQVPMLSARVFLKLKQFFQNADFRKKQQYFDFQGVQKFGNFIRENELTLSYNRYGFQKKIVKFRYSYQSHEASSAEQQSKDYTLKIKEWAEKENIQFIPNLLSFLNKIGLLVDNAATTKNLFLLQLERITKQDQRQLFLHDICNKQFQQIQKGQINEEQAMKRYPNYAFYKNKKKVRYGSMDLQQLHNKMCDYNFLQGIHDYIQWMFPNHYGSAFNSSSVPLNYTEAYLFQKQLSVGIALLRSIYIFFDFMGIRINLQTLELSICSERRLDDVILKNFHNHLRIMRILACLSVTGFRKIALNLINFLDQHTSKGGILYKQRRQFERSWQIYGEKDVQKAKRMCFLENENFPEDHEILKTSVTIQMNVPIQIEQKNVKIQSNATFLEDLNDFHKEGNQQQVQNKHQIINQQQLLVALESQNIKDNPNYAEQLMKIQQNINIAEPEENINNKQNKVSITEQKINIVKQQSSPQQQQKGEIIPIIAQKQKQVQPISQNYQIIATVEQTTSQIDSGCC